MTFLAGFYQIMEREREKKIIAEGKAITCPTGLHKIRGESSLQKSKLDFPSTVAGFYHMEREEKIIAEGKAITCPTGLYKIAGGGGGGHCRRQSHNLPRRVVALGFNLPGGFTL